MSKNKVVVSVFSLIAIIVVIFLVWQISLGDDGILVTGYDALADGVNGQFEKVAGSGAKILPNWSETGADSNGQGFDIDIE